MDRAGDVGKGKAHGASVLTQRDFKVEEGAGSQRARPKEARGSPARGSGVWTWVT